MRKGAVDYRRLAAAHSDLSLGVDPLGADFRTLHSELLSHGGYRVSNLRRVAPAQLTPEWLQQSGGFRPLLIPGAPNAARDLGLGLPEGSLTVDRLASRIGLAHEVPTFDVQTQAGGPHWTLHQWCLYWEARRAAASRELPPSAAANGGAAAAEAAGGSTQQGGGGPLPARRPTEDEADSAAVKRKRSAEEEAAQQQLKGISAESRRRLLEVAALPLTGTALEAEVSPPAAVRGVDLAQQVWPPGAPSRPSSTVNLWMSPEGGYCDFHLAMGGASVWLHCLSGRRTLALVPPTPANLATYVAWAASARHAGVFLPAHCEGVLRLELGPGDTVIIPGGWAYAAATTSASVLLGGTFLRRDALAVQLEVWRIEDHLALRPRFRYPAFKQVLWYAAAAFATRLRRLAGLSPAEVGQRAAAQLAAWAAEEEAAAAAKAAAASSGSAGSDSVSKAGAAKKTKGWVAEGGEERETADDAGTLAPPRGGGGGSGGKGSAAAAAAAAGGAAKRLLQQAPAAAGSGRPAASPASLARSRPGSSPAAGSRPRQVGRAVGGGSRLQRSAGGGAAVSKVAPRMNPTGLKLDIGRGGGGGTFRRLQGQKRQRSDDSFIEQDSGGEASVGGHVRGGNAGKAGGRRVGLGEGDEEEDDEAEWAPQLAAAGVGGGGGGGGGLSEDEDDEMSDASEEEGGLDLAELAAAGATRRSTGAVVMEVGSDGEERPRRLTARQAARQAAAAEAWDGRIMARHKPAAASSGGWSEGDDFELLDEAEDEAGNWPPGGGGGGGRRSRQSTRHGGKLPARLAAMLQDEGEAEQEEEAEEQQAAAAVLGAGGAGGAGAAAAALAAFAAADQPVGDGSAPSPAARPLKIKVRAAPAAAAAAAAAVGGGLHTSQPHPSQQPPQQQAAAVGKLKLRIKPAGGAGGSAAGAAQPQHTQHTQQTQQQQPQDRQQQQLIPQVDGAGDDQVDAMYAALYTAGSGQQQLQQIAPTAAQELPAALAAPLGQAGAPRAGGGGATATQERVNRRQQQQQQQQSGEVQQQEQQQQQWAAASEPAGSGAAGAGASGGAAAVRQLASRVASDSSAPQQASAGGEQASVEAQRPIVDPQSSDQRQSDADGGRPAVSHGGDAAETRAAAATSPLWAAQQAQQPAKVDLGEHHPAASAGAPAVGEKQQQQQQQQRQQQRQQGPEEAQPASCATAHPAAAAAAAAAAGGAGEGGGVPGAGGAEEEEAEVEGDGAGPPQPLSLEEEEGLAALLAALKQWLRVPHALNDVPLSITNPKALAARMEVCMRALGLSLQPPPPADLDSVPLERLLPVRTPRAGGTLGVSHQTPQTLGGSEFVPGELDAVGEAEDGGEFDPADLELEEEGGGGVVEESAGPKRKLEAPLAANPGAAGRAPAPPAAKRGGKRMSVKSRLMKKLKI